MWPVRPPPAPGESLSSWLIRLARGNGLDLPDFCRPLWGRRFWQPERDLDRIDDLSRLGPLVAGTGLPLDRLWPLTLNSIEARITQRCTELWLLSSGDPGYSRPRYTRQACPLCLQQSPYHKLEWRFAFSTFCTQHKSLFIDRCLNCRSRLDPAHAPRDQDPFRLCFNCKAPLAPVRRIWARPGADRLQRLTIGVLRSGTFPLQSGAAVPAAAFFEALYHTILRLRHRNAHLFIGPRLDAAVRRGRVGIRFARHLLPIANIGTAGRHYLFELAGSAVR